MRLHSILVKLGLRKPALGPESGSDNTLDLPSRFNACRVLTRNGISCYIWFEDALAELGVPTLAFDLFILVPDVDAAAKCLTDEGFRKKELPLALEGISQFSNRYAPRSIAENPQDEAIFGGQDGNKVCVILLPIHEWFPRSPPPQTTPSVGLPTLFDIWVALVDRWLRLEGREHTLRSRLAVFIGYIYLYCPQVRESEFENALPSKLVPFHRNQLREDSTDELDTERCQKQYQESINALGAVKECM